MMIFELCEYEEEEAASCVPVGCHGRAKALMVALAQIATDVK